MPSQTKEALAKIRELRQRLADAESGSNEPIAIVSVACRFPRRSATPQRFWESLIEGRDEVTEVPSQRWDLEAFYDQDPDVPGKMYARRGVFLESIDEMDADFFGISPREATWVDPQQRLFLEVSWEALERAGWAGNGISTDTGVFVGWMHNDYQNTATDVLRDLNPYIATGSAGSFLSGRLSYYLGIQGPSLAVDTACSSSLVALHLACQSLRNGECSRAMAGGVNVMVSPKTTVMTCKLQALSPRGHSRAFDAAADGYLRGEGCGVIALKRLSDARRDGDPVLAVISGSAITHNGFSSGLTAPNPESQQRVIREALRRAGRTPLDVSYLEAHGTGTELGDPIEMGAAAAVLGEGRDRSTPLLVGSVKTNLGHLEAAAGVAGVIKTVLAIQRGVIPRHLHFETPNPHIDWDRLPVRIVTENTDWPAASQRVAGVSAFGMSGTNAHLVIEAPPAEASDSGPGDSAPALRTPPARGNLLVLSGKNSGALRSLAGEYRDFLRSDSRLSYPGICHSSAANKRHFEERAAILAETSGEASERLSRLAAGEEDPAVFSGPAFSAPVVAWQFTGQGSQYAGMGKTLYRSEPVFRQWIDACSEELSRYRDEDLRKVLFEEPELIHETTRTQPALFSLHIALAELLKSWGLKPDAVLGHSVGQYAAACVAGIMDWKDGIRLIHERSHLTGQLPAGGAMAAVFADDATVDGIAAETGLSIAARNGSHRVISGPKSAIGAALARLEQRGIRAKRLQTSHAFHSSLMDPILDEFQKVADSIPFRSGQLPLICNVTGEALAPGFIPGGEYWKSQLREAVQYEKSIRGLTSLGANIVIELGPHPVLTGMAASCWEGVTDALIPTLEEGKDDARCIAETVARLYQKGGSPDWDAFFGSGESAGPFELPTYPFQRKKFWGPQRPGLESVAEGTRHPLLGTKRSLAGIDNESRWENLISPDAQRWLGDHRVFEDILFPGAGYVEMASVASQSAALEEIAFEIPLMISRAVTLQTIIREGENGDRRLEIHSSPGGDGPWTRNVTASIADSAARLPEPVSLADLTARFSREADPGEFYEMFAGLGIHYGPEFRTIRSLRYGDDEVLAELELQGEQQGFLLPPMLLDGALNSLAVRLMEDPGSPLFLPVGIGRFQSTGLPAKGRLWCHGRWRHHEGDLRRADLTIYDDRGAALAHIEELKVRAVTRAALRKMVGSSSERLLYHLQWQPVELTTDRSGEGTWLIVAEDDGWLERVKSSLVDQGASVVTHRLRGGEASFLQDRTGDISGILWNTASDSPETPDYTERHTRGILDLLGELRTGENEGLEKGFHLVTTEAQPVEDGDVVRPEFSQFWGFGRVIWNESPLLRCRLIDFDGRDFSSLMRAVLSSSAESQVAIRSERSFVPRLLPAPATSLTAGLRVEPGATYLITGGLGMLGLRAAHWLATRGAEHIVLVSRREPPASVRERIGDIESCGGRVHVMPADIGERASVEALLGSIRKKLPPLKGVIHAAGVLEDGLLIEQNWERFEKVLAPKISGARHLHDLTADAGLDFFVLYSSAASILGSPGQANYAMANAYLDGLAHQRRAAGLPAISVNFGPWEEGMAATETVKKAAAMQGLTPLSADEAHETMDRMIDNDLIQATILDVDWAQMRSRFPVDPPPVLDELWPDDTPGEPGRSVLLEKLREAEDGGADQETVLREHVEAELQQVLSLPEPPASDVALAELGLDSLMAVEFATRLQRQIGNRFAIPPTIAFDFPTVSQIARQLFSLIDSSGLEKEVPATPAAVTVSAPNEAVAIIGLDCRFPGADGPDAYWDILHRGIDATGDLPEGRWDLDALYSPEPAPGKIYTRRGGFIPDIDRFDAGFFGLSESDAAWMDPQHRMLLETSWHALEDAGIVPQEMGDRQVGVFMGIMSTDYAQLRESLSAEVIQGAHGAGLSHSAGVGRINYLLGFEGPSMAVDTASSSSLVAVYQAVQSLLRGECHLALAGGVNAILSPVNSLLLCQGGFLSPDGRSKSFSASADGFGRGEGCGVAVLKRLDDAERDGDRILAVIRGAAIGHNGRNAGLTAPSGKSQQEVIRRALQNAGMQPADIQYLEAHATGTEMGDSIELTAAGEVLARNRNGSHPLLLGSAKANLAHLEAAGGISGLIKVVLSMQHGLLPRQIHFDGPNRLVPWDSFQAKVVTEKTPWPDPERPVAGVTSLGMTGTNAHLIVEGPPRNTREASSPPPSPQLLVISARDPEALQTLANRFAESLERGSESDYPDFCRTSLRGRFHFPVRIAVVAPTAREAAALIRDWSRSPSPGRLLSKSSVPPEWREFSEHYLSGESPDLGKLEKPGTTAGLPTYPFRRKRYWLPLEDDSP